MCNQLLLLTVLIRKSVKINQVVRRNNIKISPQIEYEKIVSPVICFSKHKYLNHYQANRFKRTSPKRNINDSIHTGGAIKHKHNPIKPHQKVIIQNLKQPRKNMLSVEKRQSIELCSFTQNSDSDDCLTFISFIENKH